METMSPAPEHLLMQEQMCVSPVYTGNYFLKCSAGKECHYGAEFSFRSPKDVHICPIKLGLKIRAKNMCLQVNALTIDGATPLFNACTVGSVACTEILLENGAQPQSLLYHPSPMHEATSKGEL